MEDLKQIVAENITRLRTAANLTQAELGSMVNYSDKSISKWERGDAIPDVRVLLQLAQIFGVTVDDLLKPHDGQQPLRSSGQWHSRYKRKQHETSLPANKIQVIPQYYLLYPFSCIFAIPKTKILHFVGIVL